MKTIASSRSLLRVMGCVLLGALAIVVTNAVLPPAVKVEAQARPRVDAMQLQADVNRLKELVPSQSHTMADVGYNWANLWFAAEKKNWPLAQFYFDEAHAHILWTIRIRPVRRNPDGSPVDIKTLFDGIDSGALSAVKEAIAKKDSAQFVTTYKTALEACYACHQASAKPYLRPTIPQAPPSAIINFDPDARWPE
jgi:hypothetical protein